MTRFKLLMSEAFRSIGANKSTTLAAAVTVLVGSSSSVSSSGRDLARVLVRFEEEELAVHVFIKDGAAAKDQNQLRILLESNPLVKTGGVTYISKDQALAIMRKRAPELTSNLANESAPCVLRRRPESR